MSITTFPVVKVTSDTTRSLTEVAGEAAVMPLGVLRALAKGKLTGAKLANGDWRFSPSTVEAWIVAGCPEGTVPDVLRVESHSGAGWFTAPTIEHFARRLGDKLRTALELQFPPKEHFAERYRATKETRLAAVATITNELRAIWNAPAPTASVFIKDAIYSTIGEMFLAIELRRHARDLVGRVEKPLATLYGANFSKTVSMAAGAIMADAFTVRRDFMVENGAYEPAHVIAELKLPFSALTTSATLVTKIADLAF